MDEQDWKKAFQVKYMEFTEEAVDAAQGWGCCAIGCRITKEKPELNINDVSMKKLLTPKAYRLGCKFYDHVSGNNVEKAEATYNEIQEMESIFREEGKTYYPWDAYI